MVKAFGSRSRYVVLFTVMLTLLSLLLFGCKGDTGPAGPQGPPGSDATFPTECNGCHHLNSQALTPSSEVFADGLAGSDKSVATGTTTTVTAVTSKLPAGETAVAYKWLRTGGLAATVTTASTNPTATVVMPAAPNYKNQLVTALMMPDRTMVAGVSNFAMEEAENAVLKLLVYTASGKVYWDQVLVTDSAAAAALAPIATVSPGINNVPINLPVLLATKASVTGYNWTCTGPVGAVTLNDATTRYPYFTPAAAGRYTLNDSVSGVNVNVYAGTWRGAITGADASNNVTPDSACMGCHDGSVALDKFTPWAASGHSHIFSKNLNAGGHYGPSCFACHTVGANTSAANNGFDDQSGYAAFIADTTMFASTADSTRYSRMWSSATYSVLAKESNIQCENCHGPQVTGTGTNNSHMGVAGAPRVSLSSDVCGACHGEPMRHGRFQQWQESGHGQFDVAQAEGTNASCAGCHSAQGFMIWVKQLQAGNPLRTIPSGSITWTADTVQPITCAVCHDPHAEGVSSGEPNTATVRVTDNTPKLPAGFAATGVGRGAMCITCHNSRNGGSGTNAYLHQDGNSVFGILSSYSGPHEANQGDVLMGYNAYFVGNGIMRSPHSLIVDTCANCHMEQTPPPALLSYALGGTNHSFKASLNICTTCHPTNEALGPMLQASVKGTLEQLDTSLKNAIISRSTGTNPIVQVTSLGSRGRIFAVLLDGSKTTDPEGDPLANFPGLALADLGASTFDALAKSLWNYYLIEQDQSFGIHNPDFTFLVLGETQHQVNSLKEP